MEYQKYQCSRNAAWDVLIDQGINALPVRVAAICREMGIAVFSYARADKLLRIIGLEDHARETDGFAVRAMGRTIVFYDDTTSRGRQRFTIAHELGHIVLGHLREGQATTVNREPGDADDPRETEANMFAARLLAPACVLWGLHLHSAEDIAKACGISMQAARFRAERMELLYERERRFIAARGRSCFLLHPKEQQVYAQFQKYIADHRSG